MQADCSATEKALEAEIATKQAGLADVTAEQQAREAQATDLDRLIADSERRLQVCPIHSCLQLSLLTHTSAQGTLILLTSAAGGIRNSVTAPGKGTAVLLMAKRMQQSRGSPCNSKNLRHHVFSLCPSMHRLVIKKAV